MNRPTPVPWRNAVLAAAVLLSAAACSPATAGAPPPAPPTYADAIGEALDLPRRMTAQVDWALAPIDDADALADELTALRTDGEVDAHVVTAICKGAWDGRPPSDEALAAVPTEQRETVRELATRLAKTATGLKSLPRRASKAGTEIFKIVLGSPTTVRKAVAQTKANPAAALAHRREIVALPKSIRALGPQLRDRLKAAPSSGAAATTKLLAAIGTGAATAEAATLIQGGPGPVVSGGATDGEPDTEALDTDPLHDETLDDETLDDETLDDETLDTDALDDDDLFADRSEPDPGATTTPGEQARGATQSSPRRNDMTDRPSLRPLRIAGYALAGSGVALLTGMVSGGYARGNRGRNDYNAAVTADGERDAVRRYESGRAMIISGAVLGTAITAGGVILVILDATRHRQRRVAARPTAGRTHAGLSLWGAF